MDSETHRKCSKCGEIKPIDEYYFRYDRAGKRRRECKLCQNIKKRLADKAHYIKHKDSYLKRNKEWFKKNEQYMKAKRHHRYEKDKNKVSEQTRLYRSVKRKTDIVFRLKSLLRCRCNEAIREYKTHKAARTIALLGCTPIELRAYLESLFYNDMTWDKLGIGPGTFQIDHIEPIGLFDLSRPEEQYKAFNYSNLQPLWWDDHQAKTKIDNSRIRDRKKILANLWTLDQIRAASVSV